MYIVAKWSPISATAEHLLEVSCLKIGRLSVLIMQLILSFFCLAMFLELGWRLE